MRRRRRLSPIVITLTIVWALFLAWIAWGYLSIHGIERPAYTVVAQTDGYEVREYPAHLMAQVTRMADWDTALDEGFDILIDYLRGDNVTQESIAMTRQVGIEAEPQSELIAFSAPVVAQEKGSAYLVSFILPVSYSFATLPRPNDPSVRIVEVPTAVIAVRSFSGHLSQARAQQEEEALRTLLARDKRVTVGPARLAQFNPPWTPPFMRHNEIQIPIREP